MFEVPDGVEYGVNLQRQFIKSAEHTLDDSFSMVRRLADFDKEMLQHTILPAASNIDEFFLLDKVHGRQAADTWQCILSEAIPELQNLPVKEVLLAIVLEACHNRTPCR